jgi:molybdopterin synthase sulfur carrier subunit
LTPRQLWEDLQLPDQFDNVRIAINHQFASADTPLRAGDELAFLPPISGG